jgi:hypothetical protein
MRALGFEGLAKNERLANLKMHILFLPWRYRWKFQAAVAKQSGEGVYTMSACI